MTSDECVMLNAVLTFPEEDVPRLQFADWLDEQEPVRAQCPTCDGGMEALAESVYGYSRAKESCDRCDGLGTILDTSRAVRAQFIRESIELERMPEYPIVTPRWIYSSQITGEGMGDVRIRATLEPKDAEIVRRTCICALKMPVNLQPGPTLTYFGMLADSREPPGYDGTQEFTFRNIGKPDLLIERRMELTDKISRTLATYGRLWAGSWPSFRSKGGMEPARYSFRRGFVESAAMEARHWMLHGDDILAQHPITQVRFLTQVRFGPSNLSEVQYLGHDARNRRYNYRVADRDMFVSDLELTAQPPGWTAVTPVGGPVSWPPGTLPDVLIRKLVTARWGGKVRFRYPNDRE